MTEFSQKKKKIVYVMSNFAIGGAQSQLLKQFRYFDYSKYELHLISLFNEDDRESLLNSVPEEINVLQLEFKYLLDSRSVYKFYKSLKSIKPDLIISSFFLPNFLSRILAKVLSVPVITREHNTYYNRSRSARLVNRIMANWSKTIIAVSEEVADYLTHYETIDPKRITVINNGVDLKLSSQNTSHKLDALSERLGLPADKKIALNVGRMVKQKRLTLMIEGFAEFAKDEKDWILVFVGYGKDEMSLKNLIDKLGLNEIVFFCGEKKNVGDYYRIADCFISTSEVEGMSNTHLEALAAGVPILTTRTGGTSALIKDGVNGFLIDPASPEQVNLCLKKFTEIDPKIFSTNALDHSKNFDIRETVLQYEELFKRYAV